MKITIHARDKYEKDIYIQEDVKAERLVVSTENQSVDRTVQIKQTDNIIDISADIIMFIRPRHEQLRYIMGIVEVWI